MKKLMLSSALLSLSITAHAELTESLATGQAEQTATIATLPFDGGVNSSVRPQRLKEPMELAQNDSGLRIQQIKNIVATAPTTSNPSTPPSTAPAAGQPTAPANIVPDTTVKPTTTTPVAPNAPAMPTKPITSGTAPETSTASLPAAIDCNYHISPDISHVDQNVLLKWTEKAVQQSFEFDHQTMNEQLTALKACYTDQGWQSFNDALTKSGNADAIKTQKLTVSSMIQGTPTINEVKDNQWKVSLPLQVVYQNDKDKLTQSLTVDLIIGRKLSGDLGIMQIIASPRVTQAPTTSAPQ